MTDVFDKTERSRIMKAVKSRNTKSTEQALVKLFKENGVKGWRRTYPVKGHPDFVFLEKKVAVFVDGCFWHGHDCRNTRPSDNKEYWQKKRERNIRRDIETTIAFENRGWIVIRIWECELKKQKQEATIKRIIDAISR